MIDPKLLCRKHLLGEHGEIHKHRSSFVKKHSITKRIQQKQIEPGSMKTRHDELAIEMIRRNYNHNSEYEMPDLSYLSANEINCKVDTLISINDLISRCPECAKNIRRTK